jgi:hypothetical protein
MLQHLDIPRRARAAGIHLLISGLVAALAAALVFGVWYPHIYRLVAGGRDLFLLITAVDVVLGPLLTFAVFNLKKGRPHLRRDLAVIGLIQLSALVYGLYTVHGARPIAMVFEVDRFRVVTASQVLVSELPKALPEYRQLPIFGPWLLGSRAPRREENNDAIFMAVESGIDRSQRPLFWQPYEQSIADVLSRARPLALLLSKRAELAPAVRAELKELKLDENSVKFLPLIGRGGDWVVVIDSAGQLVHYIKADGFF